MVEEDLLAFLERDRVDDALALDVLQPGLEHFPARAVDHDRQPRDLGLGCEQVEEARHRRCAVEQVGVHVHVEQVGATAHLVERDVDRGAKSPASISRRKRAEPVTFVRSPTTTNPVSGPISNGSRPLNRGRATRAGTWRGLKTVDGARDPLDVLGCRPAAATDDVDEAVLGERAQQTAGDVGGLVVEPHRVRQTGVRVAGDVGRRDAREILQERAHLARTERAVDAGDQRLGVLDGRPERLDGLPGEVATAAVDGREREPAWDVGRDVEGGGDRGLRVQRVEDRLDQQDVDAARRRAPRSAARTRRAPART